MKDVVEGKAREKKTESLLNAIITNKFSVVIFHMFFDGCILYEQNIFDYYYFFFYCS